MASSPKRTRVKLDFTTPNEAPAAKDEALSKKTRPTPKRPICPYCFQPGVHRTAAQCMRALES